ncbi:TetR/AcrR family transcriptional regulator [Streptomyces sp. A3M-1-3]|uniref:TetR/AcrR family transcriptional regulator n=1 Tax=Streptomyces sp. A3M-1-3 TaxID=2962044 RepID=UPI0020B792AA|nr:TetR/AcrR family transcriptional regulator [Streptomyces sp. A3M-1-3]MCP3821449.1 TetR/AcrR family transcriptional regulator [Streptomyces sp. A3M-1-3]
MPTRDRQDMSKDRESTPLWERLDRPAPAPRTSLSPERIAKAAVAIADAEGLDAVTMRRLASALGVVPMAAYRYVTGKDELLELMIDHAYGELELPSGEADWRQATRALALRLRAVSLQHPWVPRADWCGPTPNQLAVLEGALAVLSGNRFDADTSMAVYSTVTSYVRGAVDLEIGLNQLLRARGWSSQEEARSELAPQMAWLMKTGRYPMCERYLGEAARKNDPQWQFEIGLDCVLDGIAARLKIDHAPSEM